MCLACVGSLPGRRDPRQRRRRRSCASSRRSACSAGSVPTTCPEHAIALHAAPEPRARGEAAAGGQRGGDLPVHRLRQADRHREDGRRTCSAKLAGHSMFADAGRARPAEDVRRLPRDRPDEERAQRRHPRPLRRLRSERVARSRCTTGSSPRTRRGPTSTRCSRGCSPTRRMPRCCAAIAGAAALASATHSGDAGAVAADLAAAWDGLRAASAAMDPDAAADEYHNLFVGVGQQRGEPLRVALAHRPQIGDARWPRCARRSRALGLARRPAA